MKQKKHRQKAIHVHVHIEDGTPKCPFCNRPYDFALPFIGGRGVSIATFHQHDEGVEMHYDISVMAHADNDVEHDDDCAYEIGGKDEVCPDGLR